MNGSGGHSYVGVALLSLTFYQLILPIRYLLVPFNHSVFRINCVHTCLFIVHIHMHVHWPCVLLSTAPYFQETMMLT